MHISTKSRRQIGLFLLAFFLMHVIRLICSVFYVEMMYSITEFLSVILVMLWMLSIDKRILNKGVRFQFLIVGGMQLMYVLLLMAKYCWVDKSNLFEVCIFWDAYYIPMTIIPSAAFLAAQCIGYEDAGPVLRKFRFIRILEGVLCFLYMTNHWHQQLVRNWSADPAIIPDEHKGIVYWIFLVWDVFFFAAAFATMVKRCRLANRLRYYWLPLLPIINGAVYFLLYFLNIDLKILGVRWINMGQMYAFMVIGFLEGCIQIGIIESNSGYEVLFEKISGQARILDASGRVAFTTAGKWPEEDVQNYRIQETPVSGGTFYYVTDHTERNRLNREIIEATERIEFRNAYLQTEQELLAEKKAIEERSRLYDRIREIVLPQMMKTKELLEKEDEILLARATVLTAYIKRRSNLEILAADRSEASVEELWMALRESADYLELCGIDAMVLPGRGMIGEEETDIRILILFYELFEWWLENSWNAIKAVQILPHYRDGYLSLQIRSNAGPHSKLQSWDSIEVSDPEWKEKVKFTIIEEDWDLVWKISEEAADAGCI